MDRYQPCPKCASEKAVAVDFTWWGGIVGPKMFTHVKCIQCGTTFNGKTGKSNQTAIAIYVTVSTIFGIVVITTFYPSRNPDRQNNPSTSSTSSQNFDASVEPLGERVAIARSLIVDRS
jgi:predicted nucleic-acid-binding Zn-ribbon protein